ncbi:acyltransferase [Micromonospora sp. WMMA1949]|uniref:acyltransferase family protein n=1 Tax=unclassified Micromonospora TaxID=2617518 RepID=UPI0022B70094|nr:MULTISPECIES: acyltransferase [unclassified Micromonospora]MCZ7428509.1 acyltransferase [Micromonospora sp. WMMA1949]WBC07392.1 acyltransferase [Micromonospora sp. WMMA1947]
MRRLRQLAQRTPPGRERYIDLLRALAITMVVLGHWGVTAIGYDDGRPAGHSALADLRWAWPLTWVAQVMPVFFLVGGYANAASLAARRRRGGSAAGWLVDRSARLIRPTTVLLLVLAAGAGIATLRGADPGQVRAVVWFATIPLWFLVAYVAVVALTPPMEALHRRFGLAVPVVLVVLVALGDLGRLLGPAVLADGNYLFGWLAVHQLGFAWYDAARADTRAGHAAPRGLLRRRLPLSRRAGAVLLGGGLVALVLLTVAGPYPVAMLHVPGERLDNAAPPSLALLAAAAAQLGLILLLRHPAGRWLRRSGPWQAVLAVNAVVLTLFLWHLTAAILLVGLLDRLGVLPTPPAGSAAWWAWRVPWLLALAAVLAVLVAVFGPVEARTRRPAATGPAGAGGRRLRAALAVAGYAGVLVGLLLNSLAPEEAPEPLGLPAPALVAYLAGAGLLRLLRSGLRRPG